jgi:hypothetical protein
MEPHCQDGSRDRLGAGLDGEPRCRNEQNHLGSCLTQLDMKKNKKPLPPLEKGQLLKTDTGYIQIFDIGKTLVDYKMTKQPGNKAVRTQATTIDTLKEYLKTQKAVLGAFASPW